MFYMILIKIIYGFSDYHLTDSYKSLLSRALNFAIPLKKIEYSKFLLPFEFLFRDIKSNSESSVDLASGNARVRDTTFIFHSAFNKDNFPPFNLNKDGFESSCKLKNENNLLIQKAGKSNTIVILDKGSYLKSVQSLLKHSSKFKSILVQPDYVINFGKDFSSYFV